MKHRFSIAGSLAAAFLFAASSLSAQIHGVPASATSLAPGHGFRNPPGIPASATSLGPRGFNVGRFNGRFNNGNHRFFGPRRTFGFGSSFFVPSGILPVYGSPYDYYDYSEVDPNAYQNNVPAQQSMVGPTAQSPAVIVIDNRGVHDATNDERAALAAGAPPPAPAAVSAPAPPEESGPTTLVVFHNGTRKEIQNYAITGKEFIDLSDGRMRRYPLADVDVQATIKENNQRGVDFRLPSNSGGE